MPSIGFFLSVILEHKDGIFSIKTGNERLLEVERLTIRNKKNPEPEHPFEDADRQFYKMPCYLRRAAIIEGAEGNVYNVTDYKAYPDNGLDDTQEFQKVLDLAEERKEWITVLVPKGEYNISGALDVYSYTHIRMEDGAKIVTTAGDIFRGAHTDEYGNACSNGDVGCPHGMYKGHLNPCSSATTASMLPKGILTRMMTAKLSMHPSLAACLRMSLPGSGTMPTAQRQTGC